MLDLKFIRDNPESVRKAIAQKGVKLNLDELLAYDKEVLECKKEMEALLAERNRNAKKVAEIKDATEKKHFIDLGKNLGQKLDALKPKLYDLEAKLKELLWEVPNIPDPEAPIGPDETHNVEVKKVGQIRQDEGFPFLNHIEILQKRNWASLESIANVCGSRTYSLSSEMVLLELALVSFALDKLRQEGFTLISVPALTREQALYNTGHFPQGRDQVYQLSSDDLYLSGTAEVPINSLHSGHIFEEKQLPLLYGGWSSCFRREAGSAGRDVKGLMRVHQFLKVEQYVLCRSDAQESIYWQKKLLTLAEEILQDLQLPYRIVECCTGDMGLGKVRMFDIEAWVPSENKYRETHSCSSLHDWQARRANLRYRDSNGHMRYCYTLNNTAIASPRILVPFLENHQQEDGSIFIPEKLRPFLQGAEVL